MLVTFLENQIAQLVDDGAKLDRYLLGRHVPLEPTEIYSVKKQIERDIIARTSKDSGFLNSGKKKKRNVIPQLTKQTLC